MGVPKVRDIIIAVFVVGVISFGMFQITSGILSEYDTDPTTTSVEVALQANEDVVETVDDMRTSLTDENTGILESIYIIIFKGFKTFVLSIVAVFTTSTAMLSAVGEYFGLGAFATYISLFIVITIIATIWYALQGHEGV